MATKNEAKVRFTAETGDLNKAIASANSQLTKLRSELRLNETQAKGTGDSLDSLKDRARILGDEYAASQSKIDALSSKLEAAKGIFGASSTEVQKLETQLNNARTAQEKIAQQITQTNAAMADMESASAQAESALDRLGSAVSEQESDLAQLKRRYNEVAAEQGESSTEARQLASQIEKTSTSLNVNKGKLQQATSAADKFDKSLDGVGDSARDAGKDLGTMDVALGDFISDTAQSGIQAVMGLEESTRQYRNEQAKLETVAKTSGTSIDTLREGYANLYAITGDETLASTAVLNMSAMGTSAADQKTLVNAAAGAWAQYGDSIPLDGLLESINESTRAGQVTGSLADALNWARASSDEWSAALSGNSKAQAAFNKGISEGMSVEDAFNEALLKCTSTQERQQLVTEAMDAIYGELGTTYRETNADVIAANEASMNLADAQAELGEAVAPLQTGFTNLISGGLSWIANNGATVGSVITGIAVALGGLLIVQQVSTGFASVQKAISGLTTAFSAISGPVGIVIAVIAALAAGIVYLWNTNETFREGVMNVWNQIVAFLTPIITQIQTMFQTYWPIIQQTVTNVMTQIWTVIQMAWPYIQQIFTTACTVIQTIIQTVWPIIQQIIQTVMTNVQTLMTTAWPIIQQLITTVMTFIQAFIDNVWPHIQSIITTVMGAISSIIETAWPVIQTIIETVGTAIQGVIDNVFPYIENIINTTMGVIQGVIETVTGIISGDWSAVWEGIQQVAESIWNGIKTNIENVINTISDTVGNVVNGISDTVGSVFEGISDTASSIWNGIKDTIDGAINGAKDIVGGAIDAIKGFFDFDFQWPHIPLPHINYELIEVPLLGSIPNPATLSISWYAEGGVMTRPTIFGAAGGRLLAGGEAGPEAIAPIDVLRGYIQEAVDSRLGGLGDLVDAVERLADRVISIEIDGQQVARATASSADRVNGARQALVNRGVSLA